MKVEILQYRSPLGHASHTFIEYAGIRDEYNSAISEKREIVYEIEDLYSFSNGEIDGNTTPVEILDYLTYIFNVEHPDDYTARSVSISDVIRIEQNEFIYTEEGWIPLMGNKTA
ncbi:YodL domain-containing protein [Cohnella soli]|uniref:YodL domain-containing protein n=1 Tax=Cohnella soli TaxID=425005 RepID=A0ABW0HPC7_9BACL